MNTIPETLARDISNALYLASNSAWLMRGKALADPDTQYLRRQVLDGMEAAKRLLESVGPPLDTEPYRSVVEGKQQP